MERALAKLKARLKGIRISYTPNSGKSIRYEGTHYPKEAQGERVAFLFDSLILPLTHLREDALKGCCIPYALEV